MFIAHFLSEKLLIEDHDRSVPWVRPRWPKVKPHTGGDKTAIS